MSQENISHTLEEAAYENSSFIIEAAADVSSVKGIVGAILIGASIILTGGVAAIPLAAGAVALHGAETVIEHKSIEHIGKSLIGDHKHHKHHEHHKKDEEKKSEDHQERRLTEKEQDFKAVKQMADRLKDSDLTFNDVDSFLKETLLLHPRNIVNLKSFIPSTKLSANVQRVVFLLQFETDEKKRALNELEKFVEKHEVKKTETVEHQKDFSSYKEELTTLKGGDKAKEDKEKNEDKPSLG